VQRLAASPGDRVGRPQDQGVGTVGERDQQQCLAGPGRVEQVGQGEPGLRGSGVAHDVGQVAAFEPCPGRLRRGGGDGAHRPRVTPRDGEPGDPAEVRACLG
jgi:hypothetical protein